MGRSKNGQAVSAARKTPEELAKLDALLVEAEETGDLATWKRARAVRAYIDGERVVDIAQQVRVVRGSVNLWLRWYDTGGAEALRTKKPPGAAPRLTTEQLDELVRIVEAGPIEAGFTSGVWTGPMVGKLILDKWGVRYHNHHIPRLLNKLGFSVQRPRKRLAKANVETQATWLRERLPDIKKKRLPAEAS
jgi:transposase